ncbi:organic solute transporter Ostalpha-domain-containing protein [Aspergillus pseudoustus]|uniref:Organic solute transporter Ostalpha-domain-containing protein n=1 Tax=Aspergillus pseudoustus TaxID=1810923 RepID=A0ABR4IWP6_9EURO
MAIFGDSGEDKHTCPASAAYDREAPEPFIGTLSFHHFNMILSGACVGAVCLFISVLMFRHATHLSKPREQIKIMKICLLLPLYSITSFLAICFPTAAVFLTPWLEVYQGLALGSFFLLLCEFLAADNEGGLDAFFDSYEPPQKRGESGMTGVEWFGKQWLAIWQYPIVALGVAIATDITEALDVYCLESNNVHFAHIWLTIIAIISVASAVISILVFYKGLKTHLQAHKSLTKLLAFKLIVGLAFLEKIIFTILHSTSALHPSATLSQADTEIGIPHLVICIQMVPFALFFPYAYSVVPYVDLTLYQSSSTAWIGLLNPIEIMRAMRVAIGIAARKKNGGMGQGLSSKRFDGGSGVYDRLEMHAGTHGGVAVPIPPPYHPIPRNSPSVPFVRRQ